MPEKVKIDPGTRGIPRFEFGGGCVGGMNGVLRRYTEYTEHLKAVCEMDEMQPKGPVLVVEHMGERTKTVYLHMEN